MNVQAERRIFEAQENKEYLPIEGLESFRRATVDLLLGHGHPASVAVRGVGGGDLLLGVASRTPVQCGGARGGTSTPWRSRSLAFQMCIQMSPSVLLYDSLLPDSLSCLSSCSFPLAPLLPVLPPQGRVASLQSLSGTGSLRVGAGFIARFLKVGIICGSERALSLAS